MDKNHLNGLIKFLEESGDTLENLVFVADQKVPGEEAPRVILFETGKVGNQLMMMNAIHKMLTEKLIDLSINVIQDYKGNTIQNVCSSIKRELKLVLLDGKTSRDVPQDAQQNKLLAPSRK
jgi:hypothetical protein